MTVAPAVTRPTGIHHHSLCLGGAGVVDGYWRRPELSAERFMPLALNGAPARTWYRTGDLARKDADGYLFIVDRAKDMIITGGENVYSKEVEDVISGHPDVVDVAVVGGGHNGLVAAAYLARAGIRVRLLERQDHVGGAAISAEAFPGVAARLSRYSYLVSLFPRQILDDLGVPLQLVRRRYSSYTPDPADPSRGILIDTRMPRPPPRASPSPGT